MSSQYVVGYDDGVVLWRRHDVITSLLNDDDNGGGRGGGDVKVTISSTVCHEIRFHSS